MINIVDDFNMASIQGIEASNADKSVVNSDSVNIDNEVHANIITNTETNVSNCLKMFNVPVHRLLRHPKDESISEEKNKTRSKETTCYQET